MKIDGFNARRTRAYGWRHGNPETDVDLYGRPVASNHIVIVRMKHCEVRDCDNPDCRREDSHQHYYPEKAKQAFPLAYGATYRGYTEWKPTYDAFNTILIMKWACDVFFVRDAVVYKAVSYREDISNQDKERLFRKGIVTNGRKVLK